MTQSSVPFLPTPPEGYDRAYFNQLIQVIVNHLNLLNTPGPVQCTAINASAIDFTNNTSRLGLDFSTNTAASVSIGATSVQVNDTAGFSATGGYATLTDFTHRDKFTYTGKSTVSGAGSLLGVPASGAYSITRTYNKDHCVTAAAQTGDFFYDPLGGYAVHVIPE
jgi:hypothetical protein